MIQRGHDGKYGDVKDDFYSAPHLMASALQREGKGMQHIIFQLQQEIAVVPRSRIRKKFIFHRDECKDIG